MKATQFSEVLVQLKALGDKMNDLDHHTMKNLLAATEKGLVALAEAVEAATSAQAQEMLAVCNALLSKQLAAASRPWSSLLRLKAIRARGRSPDGQPCRLRARGRG